MSLQEQNGSSTNGTQPEAPSHLCIIPDGNRRWGKHNATREAGFEAGMANIVPVVTEAAKLGVNTVTFYGLSEENLLRAPTTVSSMWSAINSGSNAVTQGLHDAGIKIKPIGRLDQIPVDVRTTLDRAEDWTATNNRATVYFAIAYSLEQELVDATRAMVADGVTPETVDARTLSSYMYAPEVEPVDLLIRTGGELRLSNAPSWQLAYAEMYFVDKLWPDFGAYDLRAAIDTYARRTRQYGR